MILLLFLFGGAVGAQWFVDVESGMVNNASNDVRIPGDTGTPFSLTDDFGVESSLFFRLRLGYRFGKRHTLSVLGAPLSLDASGVSDRPIFFYEEHFPAGICRSESIFE